MPRPKDADPLGKREEQNCLMESRALGGGGQRPQEGQIWGSSDLD